MVNIINELEQRNKNLLEENEVLKKQLADKEEKFKLEIWNAINNVKESESSEIAGTLMTLDQHFWPQDNWVKVQKKMELRKLFLAINSLLKMWLKALLSELYLVLIHIDLFLIKIRN